MIVLDLFCEDGLHSDIVVEVYRSRVIRKADGKLKVGQVGLEIEGHQSAILGGRGYVDGGQKAQLRNEAWVGGLQCSVACHAFNVHVH